MHAYRRDLADAALAGRVIVPRYVAPALRRIRSSIALRAAPNEQVEASSELLSGEDFWLLDINGGWAWGRCAHDDYVGYVPADALTHPGAAPVYRVVMLSALAFAGAAIKTPVLGRWPAGSLLGGAIAGEFLDTGGGFVHLRHLRAVDDPEPDAVAVAERLIGVPYRWGGRSGDGIDCSGLVQQALAATGIRAPRDSDQQRALGEALPPGGVRRRGDLVFFPGHVGLMVDAERLIHANAHWMTVAVEPLAAVVARLRPTHPEPILATHRL